MAIPSRLAAIVKAHAPNRLEGEQLEQARANADYIRSAGETPARLRDANRVDEHERASMDAITRLRVVCNSFGVPVPEGITPAKALKVLRKLSRNSQAIQSSRAGYTDGVNAATKHHIKPAKVKRKARRAQERAKGQ